MQFRQVVGKFWVHDIYLCIYIYIYYLCLNIQKLSCVKCQFSSIYLALLLIISKHRLTVSAISLSEWVNKQFIYWEDLKTFYRNFISCSSDDCQFNSGQINLIWIWLFFCIPFGHKDFTLFRSENNLCFQMFGFKRFWWG